MLTAIRQPVQVVKQKGSFCCRFHGVPTCVGQDGARTRCFLNCLGSAIFEENQRVIRWTRPFFGLSSVVLAEKVHIK
jgi:hypothetical protein